MNASASSAKRRSAMLRPPRWSRHALAAAVGIGVFAMHDRASADHLPPPQPPPLHLCPPGTELDDQRSDSVLARLRSNESGAALLERVGRTLTICYGDVREGALQSDGALVLQRHRSLAANAARLGHLLFHLVQGAPFDEATAAASALPCTELVKRAAARERQANALETKLRRSFGLAPQASEDLSSLYERRCRKARRE